MASGCIIAQCELCDDHIWEDENFAINGNGFYHNKCARKPNEIAFLKMKNTELLAENMLIRKQLDELQRQYRALENAKEVQMKLF
ncbi:hypothetical protein [Bacillus sp. REN10]|uniref:hypothetical protein n=1 Tax=Bacillus sp. REN10 TaxID=2782541 RepID=UPI00193B8E12|nr:hypothetical protein [Bacillus sp. REN10]